MIAYSVAAFVTLVVVATVAGFDTWFARIGLGTAASALAATATTEYRILARTNRGVVLLRSSRIRVAAVETMERFSGEPAIERAGTTLLANDWRVNGTRYTVAKSSEADMQSIAGRL